MREINNLKLSLQKNEIIFGTWLQIPSPITAEIMCENSQGKLGWMCIDMEHGSIDIETMVNMIRVIESYDITPIVRIPYNDYIWIHRVLDAGAKGIIVPMIKNKTETNFAVKEAYYPPLGNRSFGYSRFNSYGKFFKESIEKANKYVSVVVQIENIHAINDLENILDVNCVDGTFIGPLDLAGSTNLLNDMEGDRFKSLLNKYKIISEKKQIPMGIHLIHPNKITIKKAIDNGYRMIALGLDDVFLADKCKEIFLL